MSLLLRGAVALWLLMLAACVPLPPVTTPVPAPTTTPAQVLPAVPVAPANVAPLPATPPARAVFTPAQWSDLPGWRNDRQDEAWLALRIGCQALVASAARATVWTAPCAAANGATINSAAAARAYFEDQFSVWQVTNEEGRDTGLVTGYYEPLLKGSRNATALYRHPLYAAPEDLLTVDLSSLYPELAGKRVRARIDGRKVVPYWTRADIAAGRAPLRDKVLVYVEDPVDGFFLEIQGSGRVQLPDGSVVRVGYADQNGHPFKSVARVLIDRGELTADRASMQAIRAWGRDHPAQLPALLEENPSYVFFREVPAPAPRSIEAAIDGPIGTLGVPLARERTIAVDPRLIPLGAPVFLDTTRPLSNAPLQKLVLAQDTGGAIRGAVRADFFWGFGDAAAREAGRMKQPGRMWVLWPKNAGVPKV